MATTIDNLDSIIYQANYLRNLTREGGIPGSISDVVANTLHDIDSQIDDVCSWVNDERAEGM